LPLLNSWEEGLAGVLKLKHVAVQVLGQDGQLLGFVRRVDG
jgi:hypothetical protein